MGRIARALGWPRRGERQRPVLAAYLAAVASASVASTNCESSVTVVGDSSAGASQAAGGAFVGGFGATAGTEPGQAGDGAATAGAHAGGTAGGAGGFGDGGHGEPTDGASTACQLLWSVGFWWYEEPYYDGCVSCMREMTGQDEVSFTPCSVVGTHCFINAGCHGIWICLSNAEYAPESIEACLALASAQDQALFLEEVECVVAWCGSPDQCAYSGPTPGCELDSAG